MHTDDPDYPSLQVPDPYTHCPFSYAESHSPADAHANSSSYCPPPDPQTDSQTHAEPYPPQVHVIRK